MGLFSMSRSKGKYPKRDHGSNYYKRPRGKGGLLGKIFALFTGSRSYSKSYSKRHSKGYRHKKSWS